MHRYKISRVTIYILYVYLVNKVTYVQLLYTLNEIYCL